MRILCVLFLLVLGGCVSIPASPPPRFYSLHAVDKDNIERKFMLPSNVIIGLGPVKVPEYQDRPQIATQNKDKTLTFSEFNLWGEKLDYAFENAISEDLTAMLSGGSVKTYPWNPEIPVKYQVSIDIVQLESRLDDNLVFAAEWSVINAKDKRMLVIKRSDFRRPINPHSYSGLVETLNKACASLSMEISEALTAIAEEDKTNKSGSAS